MSHNNYSQLKLNHNFNFEISAESDSGRWTMDLTGTTGPARTKTKPWTNQAGTWTILDPLDLRTLLYPPSDEMYLSEQTCQMHHQSPWFL
ncbi:hypothetical protein LENED_004244 [Lentinula edodes]|uniref:Uncharacterized protein n=1 Tax=Lentinula edodes TaxID=5353 RepID=A0A1Q3E5Y8_LENED|nr:hypothetical protein LENED_004244 [Lentinula edodes]